MAFAASLGAVPGRHCPQAATAAGQILVVLYSSEVARVVGGRRSERQEGQAMGNERLARVVVEVASYQLLSAQHASNQSGCWLSRRPPRRHGCAWEIITLGAHGKTELPCWAIVRGIMMRQWRPQSLDRLGRGKEVASGGGWIAVLLALLRCSARNCIILQLKQTAHPLPLSRSHWMWPPSRHSQRKRFAAHRQAARRRRFGRAAAVGSRRWWGGSRRGELVEPKHELVMLFILVRANHRVVW